MQVRTDNTCAMTYINSMGGIKSPTCNSVAKQIWQWCIANNIWISAAFVPGCENQADYESRNYKDNIEWKLDESIVSQIFTIWGTPQIDLFASRLKKQLHRYAAWKPDPNAEIIDAFSCN